MQKQDGINKYMCSPEETRNESVKAIKETLFTPDSHGITRFQREVHDAVFADGDNGQPSRFQRELKKAFYSSVGKWLVGGGIAIIIGGAFLYFQVQQNTEALGANRLYTYEDSIEDKRLQEARDARQDEAMISGFTSINQKLDRLIESLIP